jgi:catechol 2,3-dioxygenase-like lactoylglutathione lyase family enzyme
MPGIKLRRGLLALLAATLLGASSAAAEGTARVASVAITVSDMAQALPFYTEVLPFEVVSDVELADEPTARLFGVFGARTRIVRLRLGEEAIELVDFLAPEGRPIPADSRSNDLWFQHVAIIVSDMAAAYERLRRHRVRHVSTGPQVLPAWNPNAGGIAAFYFEDPDGHNLEVLQFPPGKGDPRWQARDRLFLGIDHTAIAVADTERSLAFWRDALGFKVAGESENWGPEQEHLNNVFGARLKITGLRAPDGGIGVEFLEYLAPGTGRPAPWDTLSNDLWHWHVSLDVADAGATLDAVRRGRFGWVSPGVIDCLDRNLGLAAGAMVRDPDGHALLFGERRPP